MRKPLHSAPVGWVRRRAKGWFGAGPWRLLPFDTIERSHTSEAKTGVHRPERLTGILKEEPGGGALFRETGTVDRGVTLESIHGEPRFLDRGLFPLPRRRLHSLHQGCVLGNSGLVHDPRTRAAVAETARNWRVAPHRHHQLEAWRHAPPSYHSGTALSLVALDGEGFWHFLMESLPVLGFADAWAGEVDWVVVNGTPGGFQEKWLGWAGIAPEKILFAGPHTHYQFDQLLFANQLSPNQLPHRWSVETIRRLVSAPACHDQVIDAAEGDWLWLSREGWARAPKWQAAFLERYPRFQPVDLGSLDREELFARCAAASLLAGPHGAAFCNMMFCRPGTVSVEFHPHERGPYFPCFLRLAEVCGHRHFAFETRWRADDAARIAGDHFATALEHLHIDPESRCGGPSSGGP